MNTKGTVQLYIAPGDTDSFELEIPGRSRRPTTAAPQYYYKLEEPPPVLSSSRSVNYRWAHGSAKRGVELQERVATVEACVLDERMYDAALPNLEIGEEEGDDATYRRQQRLSFVNKV